MRFFSVLACLVAAVVLSTGPAQADSIKGKAGVTGKIGFLSPNDSDIGDARIKSDIGIIGGGGLIYGINDNVAVEFDVTHSWFDSDFPRSGNAGEISITNIAFGGQYRFAITPTKLVPYVGAGVDILVSDYSHFDVDTTVGVHISGGVDYFLAKSLALTAEIRAVVAPETDIKDSRGKQGNFDPSGLSTTFGVRYFFF